METGLSSNAIACTPGFRGFFSIAAMLMAAPLLAQDDTAATSPPDPGATLLPPVEPRPRINLMVTVPRAEVNQAQQQQCADQADAGRISGEIVVCGQITGDKSNNLSGTRAAAQKRYAEETAQKGAPRAPDMFGIADNGNGIGFGGVPPPAYMIDFEALPPPPAGSDADRIARGLPPLGQGGELTEEQERARREAEGIRTVAPPRARKKG